MRIGHPDGSAPALTVAGLAHRLAPGTEDLPGIDGQPAPDLKQRRRWPAFQALTLGWRAQDERNLAVWMQIETPLAVHPGHDGPSRCRTMHEPRFPLHQLMYRYLFYGWLFRDAMQGNSWERSAAWRHNCEQARWLPTYMRRWGVIMVLLFLVALVVELALHWPAASAFFYVPSAMTLPFNAVTAIAWLFLTRANQP
jgi:hypothetical protein